MVAVVPVALVEMALNMREKVLADRLADACHDRRSSHRLAVVCDPRTCRAT
jgi:hypothetical protein